jgi:tRNA-dihydrouridine synthase A
MFGACLMGNAQLVADCVKAMRDVVHSGDGENPYRH